ncbi:MAG TPA: BlaI/MecI/CopY family transcriptional regulator [Candidatus Agrococcus pullicola]|uniref:BlaI/MecI/CopY family transcriptional regulator n=1 Tax=Candidatus Agrococcus pullicola TaxID=2838429 RepID=A0A9D1YUM9_9MICO|nr:BlaI/MecI/CopY family transcriptional regulator [Candidatus Agrococcus pullicola]
MGELERRIMDLLWDAAQPLAAAQLRDALDTDGTETPAITTVLTVLSRLERKNFVHRDRKQRPHLYEPARSRAEHMAELMHDVLRHSPEQEAVLARFVRSAGPKEAELLRNLLNDEPAP